MNNKIYEIKKQLMEKYCVALGKQCTKEYIIYYFYLDYDKDIIIECEKIHYQSKEGYRKNGKKQKIEITIQKFLDDVVYDLLNRGYELEII